MNRTTLPSILTALALLALPAAGQQRANTGDGRALDANPQVGSGGVNANAPQVDYRLRNNLITGNVSGGVGFQGTIDYSAPGEFRGDLGSEELFPFRARSLPSAPGQVNYPAGAYQPIYSGGAGASVYRGYSSLAGQSLTGGSAPAYYDSGTRLVLPTARDGGDNLVALPLSTEPISALGAVRSVGGAELPGLRESPLLGIRQVGPAFEFEAPQTPRPTTDTQQPEALPDELQEQLDQQDQSLHREARINRRQLPQPVTGFEWTPPSGGEAPEEGEAVDEAALAFAPTLMIGQRLARGRFDDPGSEQQARRMRESIFAGRTGVMPGQSIYNDLVSDLREGRASSDPVEAWVTMYDIEQPDEQQVREAERQALEAMRRAYGIADERADQEASEEESSEDRGVPAMTALVEELDYNLPAIPTLAGQDRSRANELIRQAEAAMTAGDYFKAESNYRQALMYTPDEPMVRVGIAHAQLGAGLLRSSALTLRRLFEQHPELIAARYEARLLPNEERLRWVQGELNRLAETPDASADPGFLMAYLGYQINSRQLVRYGLALAQSRSPRDPLLPVLRRIWLDEPLDADEVPAAAPTDGVRVAPPSLEK